MSKNSKRTMKNNLDKWNTAYKNNWINTRNYMRISRKSTKSANKKLQPYRASKGSRTLKLRQKIAKSKLMSRNWMSLDPTLPSWKTWGQKIKRPLSNKRSELSHCKARSTTKSRSSNRMLNLNQLIPIKSALSSKRLSNTKNKSRNNR
jgi:hypothetical protein